MRHPYQLFKAFADETRLRILSLLSHSEMCVSDIDMILKVGQSKVSRHLDYLKKTELVTNRRSGAMVFYRLDLEEQTIQHQILQLWIVWGKQTQTGIQDWDLHQSMHTRSFKEYDSV